MMETFLLAHPIFSKDCHSLWYNEENGELIMHSTDEGDITPWLPVDLVMVSKEPNGNSYVWNPVEKTVIYNILPDEKLFKVEFSTLELAGVPPISTDIIFSIVKSRVLNGSLSKA